MLLDLGYSLKTSSINSNHDKWKELIEIVINYRF